VRSSRFLAPESTAAIVLGAHDWSGVGLGLANSYLRSARGILDYFRDGTGLGLDPGRVLDLFDNEEAASKQIERVYDKVQTWLLEHLERKPPVADLIIYYIGHGMVDDSNHLAMLVKSSRSPLETDTAIGAPSLARTLRRAAPHQRRIVVLDCCFSEAAARAFIGMGDLSQQIASIAWRDLRDDRSDNVHNPAEGTLLFCSCSADQLSIGPPTAERTLFTGAVLDVLRQGAEGYPEVLSFADLCAAALDRMIVSFGTNAPAPVLHQPNAKRGSLTHAPAFRNLAGVTNVGPLANAQRDLEQPRSVQSRLEDLLKESETNKGMALDIVLQKALTLPPKFLEPDSPRFWETSETELNRQCVLSFLQRTIKRDVFEASWNRFRRGEMNCFDQTLYTEEGKRAFEGITERYRSQANFRKSVDNYIVDFEKQLFPRTETSSRVKALLALEGSRFYTLLAHVAGRLR
jgi:hypothetical protein